MIPRRHNNIVSFERHLQRRREAEARLQEARSNYYFGRWSDQLRRHWTANFDRLADYLLVLQASERSGPDDSPK